ncbi:hypothetical protein PAECIP111893_02900 [Paenibacillus plantiphilus]|uniref:ABC-2 type transporter transmembrane domain-containing protein n=1 Tax=Paenibacillus plantiphilus TaxID=2905650 RepID=A0ABN8GM18_9BACL|nr:YhgE/Pip domain-containing protein [Paenibacillus plantiphilus]CAH1208792.1 hypothetical protein PAECIP111893_02900 [Paenibacillus plantiphilus]
MNPFDVFVQEVRMFLRKPMLIVTFTAVAFIPTLYAGFLIKGAWDPYSKLEELPVAVVNLDQGASVDGEPMKIGEEFAQELRKNQSFGWRFVDENEAREGMESNRYYATITIPTEFSSAVASLTSDNPRQAEIVYESNSYYNFVAGQISENATKELKSQLSQNLTEAYSKSILAQFETLSGGLAKASEGAVELDDGAIKLREGIVNVTNNLEKLATGANKLTDSAGLLHTGSVTLHKGVADLFDGINKLQNGISKLSAADKQLVKGADELVAGMPVLDAGIRATSEGADQLTAGLRAAEEGSSQLESGLTASLSASGKLSDAVSAIAEELERLQNSNAELAADSQFQKLLAMSQGAAKGARELASGQSRLLEGSRDLNKAQQKLLQGGQKLSDGGQKLLQGAARLKTGGEKLSVGLKQFSTNFTQLAPGMNQLAIGAAKLKGGSQRLQSGLQQLQGGGSELADGAAKLHQGGTQLNEGATALAAGTWELAVKLKEAAQGSAELKADDRTLELFTHPVAIKANDDRHIKKYGYGIAPYFLSIAFFAGALIFTTIFSPRNSSVEDAAGLKLFISKSLTFILMSLAQSLIVCTLLVFVLGLKVQSIPLFYVYTMVVGLVFMLICQAFVTWLDQPGRFFLLLLMIFQLVSSAGTFPLELLPGWAKAIHPWMPMSYSIQGFRDVISSGDYSDMWRQAALLSVYGAVFFVLTLIYFLLRREGRVQEQQMPA